MEIRFGCEMTFAVQSPTATVCMVDVHPDNGPLLRPAQFSIDPQALSPPARDAFGNLIRRFVAGTGTTTVALFGTIERQRLLDARDYAAEALPVQHLPPETLTYLNASRYCDSDRLGTIA